MNLLFEISDTLLIGIGAFFLLIIVIVAFFIKAKCRKIKPIDVDDRYDKDEFPTISVKEVSKDELTDEQLEAKRELQRVYDMMSKDLEKQNKASDEIEEFEKEQEENAIISYQELMQQADKLKKDADRYERRAEEVADMEIRDAMDTFSRLSKENKNSRNVSERSRSKNSGNVSRVPSERKNKSFKSSDIVSPIYGVQSNKKMVKQKSVSKREKNDIISKAYVSKEFDNEKTQNLDFLNSLKSFRKNL